MLDKEEKEKLDNWLKQPVEKRKYTKDILELALKNIFKDNKNLAEDVFGWKHDTWEDRGEKFSAWTFKTDRGSFTTGDSGKEAFNKLFKEECEKWGEEILKDVEHPKLDFLIPEEPNTFINLPDGNMRFEKLTKEQIIERYGYLLTEDQKIELYPNHNPKKDLNNDKNDL